MQRATDCSCNRLNYRNRVQNILLQLYWVPKETTSSLHQYTIKHKMQGKGTYIYMYQFYVQ